MSKNELLRVLESELENKAMKQGKSFDEGVSVTYIFEDDEKEIFESDIDFFENELEKYTECSVFYELENNSVYISVNR